VPALIDIRLIDGLSLSYVSGAEAELTRPDLDPLFASAWQGLVAAFPSLSLQPLFDSLPVAELDEIVNQASAGGAEPPDPFGWFAIPCDEAQLDAVEAAVKALPFVAWAGRRPPAVPAGNGISYGTNPLAMVTLQIQEAPNGVDAIYAWNVPGGSGEGVHLADVEGGWELGHQELLTAHVQAASVFGSEGVRHGTAVAGIIVGQDNGVGTVGIVPDANLALVTNNRGTAVNTAAAILVAARVVGDAGVVLLELATSFFPDPKPDILIEFHPPFQFAIRVATLMGRTVVEPAGNGGVDLDAFPFLAHTRPDSPTFSGAIVVGAGELAEPALDSWQRTFSSHGSRVDCFAAGSRIRAPLNTAADAYADFSGTSGASAIVAGVVVAIQGMAKAATGSFLSPFEIREILRDPALGTAMPAPAGVGTMPDLRKIARARGWARILPVGAAPTGGDSLVIAHLDEANRLVRRHWTFFTGWGSPVPAAPPNDQFELTPGQSAVMSVEESDPIARLVHDAVLVGPGGVHHLWWDSDGQTGDVTVPRAPLSAVAQGRSLAAVRTTVDHAVVAAISPDADLVVMSGDPHLHLSPGLSQPLVLDNVGNYRRTSGPALVSRAPGLADIVVIEDGGSLGWFSGTTLATVGTGWSAGVSDTSGVVFDPNARPALIAVGDVLLAAGVGSEGWLRVATIDPLAGTIEEPLVVDVQVTAETSGPVALGATDDSVVVLAVDTDAVLRAAVRPLAGGEWTSLAAVDEAQAVSPLGGVTAVSMTDLGVMALAVRSDGTIVSSLSKDGLEWSTLQVFS
jgi:hypothetical protein